MIPTFRLWLSLALLAIPTIVAGFVPSLRAVIGFIDFMLLLAASADLYLARRPTFRLSRVLPPRLHVGVPNTITLTIFNVKNQSHVVMLKDDAPEEFEVKPEDFFITIPAQSRATLTYIATPKSRGRFSFGALNLRVRGPMGLIWHERRIEAPVVVSVFPDMRGASRLLLADAALDFVNLGLRQMRKDGAGSEFARLRDYAQGDSVRDVDWKATARRRKPVTRVMESERSQTIMIAIDAGRSMAAMVDDLSKFDHAVNAALFLAFVAIRNGDRVGLVVFADTVKQYLAPNGGRTQYRRIVDTLYATKPSLTYVDYLELFRSLHIGSLRRSMLCVFTDLLDEDQATRLIDPMRRLRKKHVPICMTIKDAALDRLLSTRPEDVEGAFQRSVAAELLTERQTMIRTIAHQGLAVVDVAADKLSVAAVNKYLEVKARGTL